LLKKEDFSQEIQVTPNTWLSVPRTEEPLSTSLNSFREKPREIRGRECRANVTHLPTYNTWGWAKNIKNVLLKLGN
jgi:hypothetical protein